MPEIVIPQRFAQRRDTAANWTSANPVLWAGEIGFEQDAGTLQATAMKVGDGTTPWNTLPYFSLGGGSGSAWHSGSGAPGSGLGADGDYYLNADNGDVYAKAAGAWSVVANIKGPPGDPGAPGADGDSAYDVAVANGFVGTEAEWLASLQGADGDPGPPGGLSARDTVTINSGSGNISVAKAALLILIATTAAARCRFYCTAAARDADASRAANVEAAPGAGLLLEFISTGAFLGAPLTPGVIAYNNDTTPADLLYYNIEPVGGPMTVDLTYLVMEA